MFWFFLSIFIVTDSIVFLKGYNTYLWSYKTDLEKKVQLEKFGFEKVTVKSNIDEKDIDMIAENIVNRFIVETGTIGGDGTASDTLINIIKEELKTS